MWCPSCDMAHSAWLVSLRLSPSLCGTDGSCRFPRLVRVLLSPSCPVRYDSRPQRRAKAGRKGVTVVRRAARRVVDSVVDTLPPWLSPLAPRAGSAGSSSSRTSNSSSPPLEDSGPQAAREQRQVRARVACKSNRAQPQSQELTFPPVLHLACSPCGPGLSLACARWLARPWPVPSSPVRWRFIVQPSVLRLADSGSSLSSSRHLSLVRYSRLQR